MPLWNLSARAPCHSSGQPRGTRNMKTTRRAFLETSVKAGAFAGAGLVIWVESPSRSAAAIASVFEPNAYISITPDNIVGRIADDAGGEARGRLVPDSARTGNARGAIQRHPAAHKREWQHRGNLQSDAQSRGDGARDADCCCRRKMEGGTLYMQRCEWECYPWPDRTHIQLWRTRSFRCAPTTTGKSEA